MDRSANLPRSLTPTNSSSTTVAIKLDHHPFAFVYIFVFLSSSSPSLSFIRYSAIEFLPAPILVFLQCNSVTTVGHSLGLAICEPIEARLLAVIVDGPILQR